MNPPAKPVKRRILTVKMQNAIDQLILGRTDREVAETVGVNRNTVWEWRSQHAYFQAERLRAMLPKALDAIHYELNSGDKFKAAIAVLKLAGLESLGLAIVKGLIEAHGGGVGAVSEDGRTRVWIKLPT